MIHLGDITKIKGDEIPVVDVITGGSPCQDLSVAGKRAGLEGERSGLFMEQIRVVKEMRKKDADDGRAREFIRPRYMVWENVPGAFSSNSGKDFQAVLTEIVRIVEPTAPDVPLPEGGKWAKSGCLCDELAGWSVAWKTHDAQYHGVPQRRRRVCVLADFNGITAGDILFDPQLRRKAYSSQSDKTFRDSARQPQPTIQPFCESVSGDTQQGEQEGQGTSEGTEDCSGEPSENHLKALSFQERAGKPGGGKGILIQDKHVGCMTSQNIQSVFAYGIDQQGGKGNANYTEDVAPTILSDSHGTPHGVAYGVTAKGNGDCFLAEERHTSLSDGGGQAGQGYPCILACYVYNQTIESETAPTVTAAVGGTNTSGPKILEHRKEENDSV